MYSNKFWGTFKRRALKDERTTVNEIVLEAVARKFDIDINDFDYDILGYITTVDGKVKLLQ